MKKIRVIVPLTQRIMKMILRRPQTKKGFEVAIKSDTDSADCRVRERKARSSIVKLLVPKQRGQK